MCEELNIFNLADSLELLEPKDHNSEGLLYDGIRRSLVATWRFFLQQIEPFYFHGYKAAQVFDAALFTRLGYYRDHVGFCHETAAFTMILLRNVPSARLCHGHALTRSGEYTLHDWVEFYYHDTWWAMDFCWCQPIFAILPRHIYYQSIGVTLDNYCDHQHFWRETVWSEELYKVFQLRTFSYQITTLGFYRPDHGYGMKLPEGIRYDLELAQSHDIPFLAYFCVKGNPYDRYLRRGVKYLMRHETAFSPDWSNS